MRILSLVDKKEMSINDVEIFFKYWSVNNNPIPKEVGYSLPTTPSLELDWCCPLCKKTVKFSQMKCVTLEDATYVQYLLPLCGNCSNKKGNITLNDNADRLLVKSQNNNH